MLDLKCNFKVGKSDLLCRKGCMEEESQQHLLSCTYLIESSIVNSDYVPQYQDLFSNETMKLKSIGRILMTKFKLLNDTTMCTNVNLCAASVPQTEDLD